VVGATGAFANVNVSGYVSGSTGAFTNVNGSTGNFNFLSSSGYVVGATGAFANVNASTINAFTLGGDITGNSKNITGLGSLTVTTTNTNITSNGTIQALSFNSTSDRRAKTNIEPLIAGIDFVDQINPVKFTLKETQADCVGFIAQELLELQEKTGLSVPGLVSTENPENFTVSYASLIPVLVKAIQELKQEVDELKKQT